MVSYWDNSELYFECVCVIQYLTLTAGSVGGTMDCWVGGDRLKPHTKPWTRVLKWLVISCWLWEKTATAVQMIVSMGSRTIDDDDDDDNDNDDDVL